MEPSCCLHALASRPGLLTFPVYYSRWWKGALCKPEDRKALGDGGGAQAHGTLLCVALGACLPAEAGQLLDKTCFLFASRNSQAWLELKMRELKETVAQVSDAKGNIVQAVSEVLEDHGVQEEKREVRVLGVDERPRSLSGLPPAASSWHSQSQHLF